MWREISDIIGVHMRLEEMTNCWLSYILAQPVEIDLSVMAYFTLQYFGLTRLGKVIGY